MGTMLIVKTAGCGVLGDWAKQQGLWHSYKDGGRPGDVVLFDFTGNHTTRQHAGIVVSQSGNSLTTIEGNTSITSNDNGGKVMRRSRKISQVVGFIRPKWNGDQTAAQLLAIAESQIGTKESPANSNNVKYNTWFYGHAVSGSAYPWCAVFVCWCFYQLSQISYKEIEVTAKELKRGDCCRAVKKLQILLKGLDWNVGKIDGDFGAQTEEAVKKYQAYVGITADGIVGKKTWEHLLN